MKDWIFWKRRCWGIERQSEELEMASESTLLGAAGEHYVMSALLRRGLIAALAPQGVPNADILVTDVQGNRTCSIQVKTRREIGSDGGWHMKPKHAEISSDNLFYCFVDFGKAIDSSPRMFVLPSKVVAEAIGSSHTSWLSTPGKRGQQRNDSNVRRLLPDYGNSYLGKVNPYPFGWMDKYRDAWQLLGLSPSETQ